MYCTPCEFPFMFWGWNKRNYFLYIIHSLLSTSTPPSPLLLFFFFFQYKVNKITTLTSGRIWEKKREREIANRLYSNQATVKWREWAATHQDMGKWRWKLYSEYCPRRMPFLLYQYFSSIFSGLCWNNWCFSPPTWWSSRHLSSGEVAAWCSSGRSRTLKSANKTEDTQVPAAVRQWHITPKYSGLK